MLSLGAPLKRDGVGFVLQLTGARLVHLAQGQISRTSLQAY